MTKPTDLIGELSALPGVSGAEQPVVRYLRSVLQNLSDACEVDQWGNIIATRRGADESFRLVVGAHSDEIGFYVKAIDAQGFLRVEGVGGVPFHMMAGRPVRVGDVDGVLGAGAWHLGKKVPGDSPLYVDVGARSPEEAKTCGIEIGSPVTMVGPYRRLAGRRLAAKAMDNRIGCVVLIRLLEAVREKTPPVTIVGVVTVQEEVGLRGARMIADKLDATAVLGLDITSTGDTPDCDGLSDTTIRLGAGPSISFFDEIEEAYAASLIGIIGHPSLNGRLVEVAEQASIPIQRSVLKGGGADAAAFHLAAGGVPATQVAVPTRYTHTAVETLDLDDVDWTVDLLREFVDSLKEPLELDFLGD